MGRLRAMAPRLATVSPLVCSPVDDEGHGSEAWRKWYKLARWKRLRWSVLVRDLFTCQWPDCGKVEPNSARLVADHKTPHRGDARLFWDPLNLWTLCKPCHDSAKQAAERRG